MMTYEGKFFTRNPATCSVIDEAREDPGYDNALASRACIAPLKRSGTMVEWVVTEESKLSKKNTLQCYLTAINHTWNATESNPGHHGEIQTDIA